MIIDGHAHIGFDIDGTSSDASFLLSEMQNYKVDRAVIFPLNETDPGVCFSKANDLVSKNVSKYPFKFIGFARLNPIDKFASVELHRAIEYLKLRGVKLHPVSQSFKMSDERLFNLAKKICEYDVPIIFHTQKAVGDTDLMSSFEEFVGKVVRECPIIKIIMGHSGMNFGVDDAIRIAKKYPKNLFLELSVCRSEIIEEIIRSVNSEQIIFGTDLPYGRSQMIETTLDLLLNKSSLKEYEKNKILSGNIAKLVARDFYWKIKKNQESRRSQENDEIGKCAVISSRNPIADIKKLISTVYFDFVETAVYPVDFTASFFLTKTIFLHAWFDEVSLTFLGDGWNDKVYVFTPSVRFSEISNGKTYLPELVSEEDKNIVIDAPVDGKGSLEILSKILTEIGWEYSLKPVKLFS
ncbi:MAG: amidohydrolase family protein [Thermoproteota archaeon]